MNPIVGQSYKFREGASFKVLAIKDDLLEIEYEDGVYSEIEVAEFHEDVRTRFLEPVPPT